MSSVSVSPQLRNLQDLSTSFDPSTLSPHERLLAKEAAYKLFRPIENPLEFAVRSGWEHAGTQVSLQIASDLELFPKWRAQNKGATMTGKQLAEMTGVGDVDLLRTFILYLEMKVFAQTEMLPCAKAGSYDR